VSKIKGKTPGILFTNFYRKDMVRMPTALAVVGAVVIILAVWMMINEVTGGARTLYAGIALELLAVALIIFRSVKRR
jgi:hypothetical protein